MGNNGDSTKGFEFKKFATPRIIGGIVIIIIVLWALSIIFSSSEKQASRTVSEGQDATPVAATPADHQTDTLPGGHATATKTSAHPPSGEAASTTAHGMTTAEATTDHGQQADTAGSHEAASTHDTTHQQTSAKHPATTPDEHAASAAGQHSPTTTHRAAGDAATGETTSDQQSLPATAMMAPVHKPMPRGVAFVEAAIKPMEYELEERWWGWRPNDIIDVTDNVNHFQLGVLEITRRTVVALAERISRHGVTDALDPNLEEAMNWFMVKASSYWFPSAESKYKDGLDEMRVYLEHLKAGNATFYIRSDNLIPLLASFEDLLGSCDENLVKELNEDGTPVSFFAADDYFYYTQGVASAMAMVLEAVHHDFLLTLESRNATDLLHHAILSCQRAADMDPWIILDRNLSSIFANHRANMAAPISHARFYLGQLIKTLST
jgi:hypothetical protein